MSLVSFVGEALSGVVAVGVGAVQPVDSPIGADGGDETVKLISVGAVVGLALTRVDLAIKEGVAEIILSTVLNLHGATISEHPSDVGLGEVVSDTTEEREEVGLVDVVEHRHLFKSETESLTTLIRNDLLDVTIEFSKVEDGVNDTRRRPGHHQTIGIFGLQPGRESTRVGATRAVPLHGNTTIQSILDVSHEVTEIFKNEIKVERVEEEFSVSSVTGKRNTIPTMFQGDKERIGLLGYVCHVTGGRTRNGTFTIDIELGKGGLGSGGRARPEGSVVVPLLAEGGLVRLIGVVVNGLVEVVGCGVGSVTEDSGVFSFELKSTFVSVGVVETRRECRGVRES